MTPVDILTADGKKTSGKLMHARVRVVPVPGEFQVTGFLVDVTGGVPEVLVNMTLKGDTLAILDHALGQFRQAFRAAVKELVAEMRNAGLPTGDIQAPTSEDIQIVKESKGS